MKAKINMFLLVLFSVLSMLISCKDASSTHIHCFDQITQECMDPNCNVVNEKVIAVVGNDARFISLQDAIDYVKNPDDYVSSRKGNRMNRISLVKNANGEGIVLDSISFGVVLDFGNYSYTITGDKGICCNNTDLSIEGKGELRVSDNSTVGNLFEINNSKLNTEISFKGCLKFEDKAEIVINGGTVEILGVKTTSSTRVVFSGDASICYSNVAVASLLNAYVSKEDSSVVPKVKNHSHDWSFYSKTSPTCMSTGYSILVCNDCKSTSKTDFVLPLGHCVSHYMPKTPTSKEFGNIEYWKCLRCDKFFSDSEGMQELSETDIILPKHTHRFENGVCSYCGLGIVGGKIFAIDESITGLEYSFFDENEDFICTDSSPTDVFKDAFYYSIKHLQNADTYGDKIYVVYPQHFESGDGSKTKPILSWSYYTSDGNLVEDGGTAIEGKIEDLSNVLTGIEIVNGRVLSGTNAKLGFGKINTNALKEYDLNYFNRNLVQYLSYDQGVLRSSNWFRTIWGLLDDFNEGKTVVCYGSEEGKELTSITNLSGCSDWYVPSLYELRKAYESGFIDCSHDNDLTYSSNVFEGRAERVRILCINGFFEEGSKIGSHVEEACDFVLVRSF